MSKRSAEKGFTLVELVTIIVITGILAGMGAAFIFKPVEGYVDLNRRAALVDSADLALRRMQRDIRQALPNSIRLHSPQHLELLHTVDGGRYRARGPGDLLDFAAPDTRFDVLGSLRSIPSPGDWLVVYNLSASGAESNAYAGDNRAAVTGGDADSIQFSPRQFPRPSPYGRFFLVDETVSYVCDPAGGTLKRYAGYPMTIGSPTLGGEALVTRRVAACSFTYAPGTSRRGGLVTLELTLADTGEQVSLLHQVHVENAP